MIDKDIEAAVSELVAHLPASYGEMTVELLTEVLELRKEVNRRRNLLLKVQQDFQASTYYEAWASQPDDLTLGDAVQQDVIPMEVAAQLQAAIDEGETLDRAMMILEAWEASAGHPAAFSRGPLRLSEDN